MRDRRETFIPLTYSPGRRLEADFGHIHVDFPEGRRQVSVLLADVESLGVSLCRRVAQRADRGDPGGDGRGIRVLWLCALAKRNHTMAGKTQTVGELFEQDKQAALALPARAFDPFVPETAKVDKYQTVRFDTNRYSVPRRWAFETVTIKAYVNRIEVVSGAGVIARHERSYCRGEWIVQPPHYLAILGRRVGRLPTSTKSHVC